MLAVNYATIETNLRSYCDKVTDNNETLIVTRNDEKNIVIISFEEWNNLQKAAHNADYLHKIERSLADCRAGRGIVKSLAELEAMEQRTDC